jgi:hypothetical protein
MTPEERIIRNLSQLKLLVEADVKEAIAAAYREGLEDAAGIAEACEVTLNGDDLFGNLQIAAAIRAKAKPSVSE